MGSYKERCPTGVTELSPSSVSTVSTLNYCLPSWITIAEWTVIVKYKSRFRLQENIIADWIRSTCYSTSLFNFTKLFLVPTFTCENIGGKSH